MTSPESCQLRTSLSCFPGLAPGHTQLAAYPCLSLPSLHSEVLHSLGRWSVIASCSHRLCLFALWLLPHTPAHRRR